MEKVKIRQISVLLEKPIKEIGITFVINYTNSHLLMDTLYFQTTNDIVFQLLIANQNGLNLKVSSKQEPIIDPEYEIEPKDKLIFKKIEISDLNLPIEFKSITEFWAGSEGKDFLIGFILHGDSREALLSIRTETDEIELMAYNAFRQRVENFPYYYGKLSTYWYQK